MTPEPEAVRVVATRRALAATCERLASAPFVAVDTEFVRDRTYYARPCLVQLAGPDIHALVDPLALTDLEPLRRLLVEAPVLKVLHAARQDLELFHAWWDAVPGPVVDTQVAAGLLGIGDQVGLQALVRDVLGIEMPKGQTMTDWARRPLSEAQLRYAAADVVHLVPAWEDLSSRLAERGRLGWLHEEGASLGDPSLYRTEPSEAWQSVRGAGRLRPKDLSILRELAAWREETAQERDRPRRWILPDDVLLELARRRPATTRELADVPGLEERSARRHGRAVVAAVRRGLEAPAESWPQPVRRRRLAAEQATLAELMGLLVKLRAREHDVAAPLLAPRAQLERVAAGDEDEGIAVLHGWRRGVVGDDLLALRDGRLRLVVEGGEVRAEPT